MDWRLKCAALHLLRYMPRSAHTAFQRRITRRYFFTLTEQTLAAYNYHVENFHYLKKPSRVLEFGAGSNLISALLLSAAGATEVLAYDLSRIATVEQVNHVIRQLRDRVPGEWPEITDLDADLFQRYHIRYIAPADARDTGLPAGSVDFFCSTSTLEHIPARDIERILTECKRLASPMARFSFIVDYHDHYCSADPNISRVNFYRYSDALWRFLNPTNHYQNRLRHSEYEHLFAQAGLKAIEQRPVITPVDLDGLRIHIRFARYSQTDLTALNGFFHLIPDRLQ